jgi:hypothetical protein
VLTGVAAGLLSQVPRDEIQATAAGEGIAREATEVALAVRSSPQWGPLHYLGSAFFVAVALGIGLLVKHFVAVQSISLVFLTAVFASAVLGGLLPSLFTCVVSVVVYNLFFLPPLYTFSVGDPENAFVLFFFLLVAVVVSTLAARPAIRSSLQRWRRPGINAYLGSTFFVAVALGIGLLVKHLVAVQSIGDPENAFVLFFFLVAAVVVSTLAERPATRSVPQRRSWTTSTSQQSYEPDPLAVAFQGEPVDRSGRPLPWRWERSLSRDLLGQHGLMLVGAAAVISALAYTTRNEPPVGAQGSIPTPPAELPQTPANPPAAQMPNAPQVQRPDIPQPNLPPGPPSTEVPPNPISKVVPQRPPAAETGAAKKD